MRRVPAVLIVLFFVLPLLSTSFFMVGISTWALDRTFYTGLISDERLYRIPDAVSSATWGAIEIPGTEGFTLPSSLKAAREVLTPAYLRSQAVNAMEELFSFFEGRRPFDLSLDLQPVKSALLGDPGKRFARILAGELPVGGTDTGFTVKPGRLPSSRPSTISVDKAAAVIQAGLPTYVKALPDRVRLSDSPSYRSVLTPWGIWAGFPALGALALADVILLLLAGGFLAAAVFIGGAARFERLQWAGWPLLIPAAATFVVGLFITLGAFSGWVPWGIESARLETIGYDSGFVAALIDLARHVMTRVGIGFIATGAVAAGIAMGLLGVSWSIPQESRKGADA